MSFLPTLPEDGLSPEARAVADAHLADFPEPLGALERTLLADPALFDAYRGWFQLREQIVPYLGERVVDLYCHALSKALGAPHCVARFRAVLEAGGDDPDNPQLTDVEQLLIEWGAAIGTDPGGIPAELTARVEETFQPRLRALLTGFAGLLAAISVFSLVAQLDDEA